MGRRYDAIATQKPGTSLDAVVRFCRVDLPLIAFCAGQFAVFACIMHWAGTALREAMIDLDLPLPGGTLLVLWVADHFWTACAAWVLLVGVARWLARNDATEVAVVLVLIAHVFANSFVIIMSLLSMLFPVG